MISAADEMRAFDRLPAAVRARLSASRFDFRPSTIMSVQREFRLTAAEAAQFIGELEGWASEAERTATQSASNRLEPARPPNVEAMVERIRTWSSA